jgi:hypothetical protein
MWMMTRKTPTVIKLYRSSKTTCIRNFKMQRGRGSKKQKTGTKNSSG